MDEMYVKGILYAAKLAEQKAKQLADKDEIVALNVFADELKCLVIDDIIESGVSEYNKYSATSD